MNIIRFENYKKLNENVAAAKAYTIKAIKDGKIDPEFFDRSITYSGYNTIINALGKNLGYAYFFIKHYIDYIDRYSSVKQYVDEKVIPILEKINYLKSKNKFSLNINDQKYKNSPIEVFETDLNTLYNSLTRPGIILDESDIITRSPIYSKLKEVLDKIDYKVVIAAKKDTSSKKSTRDINTIFWWASPTWCLKNPKYFDQYVKDDNYLQYIFIDKNIYNEIVEAQSKGTNIPSSEKKVPINWTNYKLTESLSGYEIYRPTTLRFGVTTPPLTAQSLDDILKKSNKHTDLDAFDDADTALSTSRVMELTNIDLIDVYLRQILKLAHSQYSNANITINMVLDYINLDDELKTNKTLNELINENNSMLLMKITNAMQKLYNDIVKNYSNQLILNEKFTQDTINLALNNDIMFLILQPLLFTIKDLSDDILNKLIEFYKIPIDAEYKTIIPFTVVPMFLYLRYYNRMSNDNLINTLDEYLGEKFLIENTETSFGFDYIMSIEDDFKTVILTTENKGTSAITFKYPGIYNNTLSIGAYKMTADFIYLFRKQLLAEYKSKYNWNKEIDFINKFINYAKNNIDPSLESFASENVKYLYDKIYKQLQVGLFYDSGVEPSDKKIKNEIILHMNYAYQKVDLDTDKYVPAEHNVQLLYCMKAFFTNYQSGNKLYKEYFKDVL